ncbi:MAG: T9SS type A sorting domain-containing protein [Flavobacteriales bacterium]
MEHTCLLRRVLILLTALILLSALPANGQIVPIPDIAFRQYLQTNYPQVMVGDDLNTDAPELATITSLHLAGVTDFTGIEHFEAVDSLSLNMYVGLDTMLWPQILPPNVKVLSVQADPSDMFTGPYLFNTPQLIDLQLFECRFQENALPEIPAQVERLMLYKCWFTTVPVFSASLRYLVIDGMDAAQPPAAWPSTLDTLGLYDQDGLYLQEWLDLGWPDELKSVHIEGLAPNAVFDLPPWPSALEDISILYVDVQNIPTLPTTLHRLEYIMGSDGLLDNCLPSLPLGLEELIMVNPITCLPNKPPAIAADPAWDWALVCTIWNSLCLGGNEIQGTVFNDLDNDGVFDGGESGMPNGNVVVQPGNVITSSAGLGDYSAWVSAGNFTIEALPYLYQTPTGAPQTASFSDVGGQDTGNDLGLYVTPNIQDLVAGMFTTAARPGFENVVWLDCQNVGTIDVNGTLQFTFDTDQSYVNATPAPSSVNGNILQWPVTALMGGSVTTIEVVLYTDPAVPIGTPLTMSCVVDPVPSDETPADNSIELVAQVVGSYDPNDKHVRPMTLTTDELAEGRTLEYTIRFQNTGNYLAEDVLITDMLSDALDPHTFHFGGSSHPCQWYISNGQLQVLFDNIMLPDNGTDEVGSHGFVSFRIAPVAGLANDATVENSASITFDFNAPIVTEPAVFTVDDLTSSVVEQGTPDFTVYPNPADEMIWLGRAGQVVGSQVQVLDVSGRVTLDQLLVPGLEALDISILPAGIYQLRVTGSAQVSTARFVKR